MMPRRSSASPPRERSIVAVAYGAPGQVLWIERNRPALSQAGVRIVVGVGGALDYWAGTAKLAPPLIRKLGFEWLYRLILEPWRWRRQLVLPVFALLCDDRGRQNLAARTAIIPLASAHPRFLRYACSQELIGHDEEPNGNRSTFDGRGPLFTSSKHAHPVAL